MFSPALVQAIKTSSASRKSHPGLPTHLSCLQRAVKHHSTTGEAEAWRKVGFFKDKVMFTCVSCSTNIYSWVGLLPGFLFFLFHLGILWRLEQEEEDNSVYSQGCGYPAFCYPGPSPARCSLEQPDAGIHLFPYHPHLWGSHPIILPRQGWSPG